MKTFYDTLCTPNQQKIEDEGWIAMGLDRVEIGNLVVLIKLISNRSYRYWKNMKIYILLKNQVLLYLCNLDHGISNNKQLL